ncbi:RmlC-like cupin domain-containing protein [Pelagophyceae sp. CCMP2097]|nr:RmlC-like cupin domain-containing protein [Pelagophyceae sp. CCMP2097]
MQRLVSRSARTAAPLRVQRALSYYVPRGGHPAQTELCTGRAVFTEAYAVLPKGVMRDIVTSLLPNFQKARAWIIARPMSGFIETFSQYIVEVSPGGGTNADGAEVDAGVEAVLFVVGGDLKISIAGRKYTLQPGGYAYVPPGVPWTCSNKTDRPSTFHWIRKRYEAAPGISPPAHFVTSDAETPGNDMPGTDGAWSTKRFADPDDLAHDMHVNIVTFKPGASIPFLETHVMEHGLYVLEGKAVYGLNKDWVEVEAGDFMVLRAFCPQACYAGGPSSFRYLLYKDVNRHAMLPHGKRAPI